MNILFVTHKRKRCGVYEFGNNVFNAIASSSIYKFYKIECDDIDELKEGIAACKPKAIIFNYHPSVMPWLCSKVSKGVYKNNIAEIDVIKLGIIHEVTQHIADTATGYTNKIILGASQKKLNSLFDYYIAPDPTLLLKNSIVYKTGRLIIEYTRPVQELNELVFGSFGFATPKKGFEKVVEKVQEEFDNATIKLNIPPADFGDEKGENAKLIAKNCRALVKKPGIKLEISHDFLSHNQLLDFLSSNTLNVFMYEDKNGRGISSATDSALAVKRPIAISRCLMFRHILEIEPSVCVEDNSLRIILSNGFAPLEKVVREWSKEVLTWEYERILNRIISFSNAPSSARGGLIKRMNSKIRRLFSLPDKTFTWLRDTVSATKDDITPVAESYTPIKIESQKFNRILNDEARRLYKPAIEKLTSLVPITMSKKISRANVQQGFVFDTVIHFIKNYSEPKLLCVGSYEDTASMGLIKLGYQVEEIDPMLNYYLQEYYSKPTTQKESFDIIFSTSVIEHDPDDESFLNCIEGLLKPGGIGIITCDYKDGWKPTDPKPEVDARFYTQKDLKNRLPGYIPNCKLIDEPQWECPNPDFHYLGKYVYTFATFVFKKNQ